MNINDILSFLGDSEKEKIASQAGIERGQVETALQGALPTIVSALKGNADSKVGLKQLDKAIGNDHDGSLLDNLSDFLSNPKQANGKGILNHAFASRRTAVEDNLSMKTGISSGSMGKILEIAAPLVLSYLGKKKKEERLDTGGIGSLLSNLFDSNANSSEDPADNGLDVSNIASMFINSRRKGMQGFMDGLMGFK